MQDILKIENLKYKNILKDITFSLKEKSFNILIGANSSGKTTIVNCIRGLNNYKGNISINNNNIKNNQSIYNNIGFFLDNKVLLESTLFNELLLVLKNLNYEEIVAKKKIYSLSEKLEFTNLLFKSNHEFTNQEKTIISFLFSIIHDPDILIIDNDIENLDEVNKNKIFNYIRNNKNLTTLFITNNSEYFYEEDNLLFLKDGKIILSGKLKDLIDEEKTFIKCGSNLPFLVDLSNKLITYELLTSTIYNVEKMVNEIWK